MRPNAQPFASEAGAATGHLPDGAPDPRWRKLDRLIVVAFVLALFVPGGLLAAGLRPPLLENRPLLKLPRFSVGGVLDASWPAGTDAFLADNMALRGIAVRARGELYWRTGSRGNPAVIPGLDGWAFTRGEFEPICEFTADEIVASLADAAARLRAAGRAFRFLLVPDKHTIYPDRLRPDIVFPPACNDTERAVLRTGLAAHAPGMVDGIAVLSDARRLEPDGPDLYYSLDSHWTPTGATAAIRALIQSLDPALWREEDVTVLGNHRRTLELANQIGIRRTELTPMIALRPSVTVERRDVEVPVDIGNARGVFRMASTGDLPVVDGRTMVVYDSFFGLSASLVAPFFADSTWIHVGDLANHPELAQLLGPFDTVIFERVERGLYGTDVEAVLAALATSRETSLSKPGVDNGPGEDMAAWAAGQDGARAGG